MPDRLSRRDALKRLGALGTLGGLGALRGVLRSAEMVVAGRPVEVAVFAVSRVTVRITVRPIESGDPVPVPTTGALVSDAPGTLVRRTRVPGPVRVRAGDLVVGLSDGPPTIVVETRSGETVQRLTLDASAPGMSFLLPNGPLLGLGEGGPQFDRRGAADPMRNGQGGYRLATHGTRAPIQWLIGTGGGWAMFVHQPYGAFDLTGSPGRFTPPAESALPLDVFVVASHDPAIVMREYARVTGLPIMPPRWALGYQQSHRTLGGRDEILGVARTMREKRLPCDALIYLGTEFAPSGWNTRNGEFTWHAGNFPDPKAMLDTLHAEHFHVVLHAVVEGRRLTGRVTDPCTAPPLPSGRTPDNRWPPDRQVSCYWPAHRPLMALGVDGWWPDQGDGFDGPSRFNRHRMYYEGSLLERPNERPYALHRNASAGVQRFGGFVWSGDVHSRWETLATHVAVAINSGLSGLPYWGTDIGGFVPTAELTGELFVRWFQFGAFNPLFRSHGRNWHLHLPWGWDGGDGGPPETGSFHADPAALHDADVEPICRKYLELRMRLMPYLYTAVRDACDTGMPIVRALWLHHPDDSAAVADGTAYLWGRDVLVAPVVEQGATVRRAYLPRGRWWDFWTGEPVDGGRTVERAVDLATLPLWVRGGAVIPLGPVRQWVDEPSDAPTSLRVYPGADGRSTLYDDDGHTLDYRHGAWSRLALTWDDRRRRLTIAPAGGTPRAREFEVVLANGGEPRRVRFTGKAITVAM
ncbi:glycoside hydrolase family 31 (plasmid) [Gemmatirosa kalamazoonensis]|uniref:Glycoside hydrolase family 31 n=1 Tax=Gemmatirosa kalamazoonensis TaxID=861299 RepID=W0RPX8_9BACT|nr:TIM-barrel domain-containing protein [Gemmatirosa kalamazoonensis]AHG92395.1 glycoside hydrolase family 31 [Gemmatirosa kalamazoonensis]